LAQTIEASGRFTAFSPCFLFSFRPFLLLVFVLHAHDFSGYRADLHFVDGALRIADVKRVNQLAMLALEFAALDCAGCTLESDFLRMLFVILACFASFCSLLASSCPWTWPLPASRRSKVLR